MSTAPEPTDEEVAQALFVIGNGNGNPSSTFAAPEPPSASVPSIDGADHPATQNGESGPVDAESSYSAGFSAIDPALFPAEAAPADSGPSISAARGRGRGVRRGGAKRAQRQSRGGPNESQASQAQQDLLNEGGEGLHDGGGAAVDGEAGETDDATSVLAQFAAAEHERLLTQDHTRPRRIGASPPPRLRPKDLPPPPGRIKAKTERRQSKLTNLDRRQICEYANEHKAATQEDIAQKWQVDRSSVSKILKFKEKWLSILPGTRAARVIKHRGGRFPQVEAEIVRRCRAKAEEGQYLGDKLIKEMALSIANEHEIPEGQFRASNGWLDAFKDRAGIKGGRFLEEGGINDIPHGILAMDTTEGGDADGDDTFMDEGDTTGITMDSQIAASPEGPVASGSGTHHDIPVSPTLAIESDANGEGQPTIEAPSSGLISGHQPNGSRPDPPLDRPGHHSPSPGISHLPQRAAPTSSVRNSPRKSTRGNATAQLEKDLSTDPLLS